MHANPSESNIRERLIDQLYVEAMVLSDEARSYFDNRGHAGGAALGPMGRVAFSSESLKLTTRLMHIIAWLLAQRAGQAAGAGASDVHEPAGRLGCAPMTEAGALADLPGEARAMIASSIDLHRRVAHLDTRDARGPGPARAMFDRLSMAF